MIHPSGVGLVLACLLTSSCVQAPTVRSELREGLPKGATSEPVVHLLPESRGGQDRIGTRFPAVEFDAWWSDEAHGGSHITGTVTLYRWWTDGCRFCETSLPAIETLRRKYADRGLTAVAVYHPKSRQPLTDDAIRDGARARGFLGFVAEDRDWSELRRSYLDWGERRATSVTIIVDRDGVVRFVHPGPEFYPSEAHGSVLANSDFEAVDRALEALLDSR